MRQFRSFTLQESVRHHPPPFARLLVRSSATLSTRPSVRALVRPCPLIRHSSTMFAQSATRPPYPRPVRLSHRPVRSSTSLLAFVRSSAACPPVCPPSVPVRPPSAPSTFSKNYLQICQARKFFTFCMPYEFATSAIYGARRSHSGIGIKKVHPLHSQL